MLANGAPVESSEDDSDDGGDDGGGEGPGGDEGAGDAIAPAPKPRVVAEEKERVRVEKVKAEQTKLL